ncbi:glycoside hydrolase family 18 protein [Kibdelosporangium philippinense]|uniref:chitinase n=1 Tax=Kibdelosporangium philippinense TaxID=211113 RepID=A0ABS8ZDT1_9PSEU|nr:glycoside hydrolase family 18 protein [Kibdelosporangium philippinense]MCE7003987.1 glycoside hydrolase family 18 protein [Kibdelosporangium philippinense]
MSRKRWGAAILAGALSIGLTVAVSPAQAHDYGNGVRTVGYYTQWSIYDRNIPVKYLVDNGSAAKLSHLNYAFSFLDEQGKCISSDAWADYQRPVPAEQAVNGKADEAGQALMGNLNQIKQLKAKFPKLRAYISIGGWTGSKYFSNAALTPESRAAHVKSCIDMWLKGDLPGAPAGAAKDVFDGVDLDWEWPATDGAPGNVVRPEDKQNFTKLLFEYRLQLLKLGFLNHKTYDLTAFLPANRGALDRGYEVSTIFKLLTFATVQGYDYHGTWEQITNQQSAIRAPEGDPTSPPDNSKIVVDAYLERGAPKDKIVLGVPYYGRGWTGVTNQNNGLFQQSTGPAKATYEPGADDYRVLKNLVGQNGFKLYRDAKAGHAWLFDGTTFWTFDDPIEIKRKGQFIRDRRLGGAMIWSLDGDTPQGELSNALASGLRR